jgi:hypothetical protein
MVVDCSDSRYTLIYFENVNPNLIFCPSSFVSTRVNEQGIFSAKPGTMFTASNIANQFDEDDLSSFVPILSLFIKDLVLKLRSLTQQCGSLLRSRIAQG